MESCPCAKIPRPAKSEDGKKQRSYVFIQPCRGEAMAHFQVREDGSLASFEPDLMFRVE